MMMIDGDDNDDDDDDGDGDGDGDGDDGDDDSDEVEGWVCASEPRSVLLPIYIPISIGMSGKIPMQEHSIHESCLSHFIVTFSF